MVRESDLLVDHLHGIFNSCNALLQVRLHQDVILVLLPITVVCDCGLYKCQFTGAGIAEQFLPFALCVRGAAE
jgi:hypothetical protein